MAATKANFSGMFSWVLKRHHRALKSLLYSSGNLRDKIIIYQISDWQMANILLSVDVVNLYNAFAIPCFEQVHFLSSFLWPLIKSWEYVVDSRYYEVIKKLGAVL